MTLALLAFFTRFALIAVTMNMKQYQQKSFHRGSSLFVIVVFGWINKKAVAKSVANPW